MKKPEASFISIGADIRHFADFLNGLVLEFASSEGSGASRQYSQHLDDVHVMSSQDKDNEPNPTKASDEAATGQLAGDCFLEFMRGKAKELVDSGVSKGLAFSQATFEARITQWPTAWGDDLVVIIAGDFIPPNAELHFPELGITIEPQIINESIVVGAGCVLQARVKVSEKSANALVDASARIDTLLGALAVTNWGNSGWTWWSYVTHGSCGGMLSKLDQEPIQKIVTHLQKLPPEVAIKVKSAMHWIREPRNFLREAHRIDVLRLYAGYWNAFECLVDAVCLLCPQPKPTKVQRQAGIKAFFSEKGNDLDAADIAECYRLFVDTGFVSKATYALTVCFPSHAASYVQHCFRMKPKQDRLYDIRNAINHGDVDASNPSELLRIDDRCQKLWMIVFGMLGLIIPMARPIDPDVLD